MYKYIKQKFIVTFSYVLKCFKVNRDALVLNVRPRISQTQEQISNILVISNI